MGEEERGRNEMTKREKIIVSAYTGYLMCDFADIHEYCEKLLGRPIFTHEFADQRLFDQIREKSKADFLAICEDEGEMVEAPPPPPST